MFMTYAEKLKDPRWQKKRLEIMQRDNFSCQICKEENATLHVHHKNYIFGNDPWDYIDENFITLCWSCHQTEEYCSIKIKDYLYDMKLIGFTNDMISGILYKSINNYNNGNI